VEAEHHPGGSPCKRNCPGEEANALLKIENINVYYGPIHALKDVSLSVSEGSIVSLIGANGAGKTTTLKTISGLLRPKSGTIRFRGQDITSRPAQDVVSLGISQVPEGRRVFPAMSVQENLEMGAYLRKDKDGIAQDFDNVFKRFPRLKERRKQMAGTLSGGEQQMLAIGRALMARPVLMLLDEPSMGLAPLLVREIFEIIKDINANGTTILLVEQNARMALSIADKAYVLETGSVVLEGEAKEMLESDQVKQAYLGG
jgi:branched-chain amino acid transport system ATP-binding protein